MEIEYIEDEGGRPTVNRAIEKYAGREGVWQVVRDFLEENQFAFPIAGGIVPAEETLETVDPYGEHVVISAYEIAPEVLDDIATLFCTHYVEYLALAKSYVANGCDLDTFDLAPEGGEELGELIADQEEALLSTLEMCYEGPMDDSDKEWGVLAARREAARLMDDAPLSAVAERLYQCNVSVPLIVGFAAVHARLGALYNPLEDEEVLRFLELFCEVTWDICFEEVEDDGSACESRPKLGTAEGLAYALQHGWDPAEGVAYLRRMPFETEQPWRDEANKNFINLHKYSNPVVFERIVRATIVLPLAGRDGFRSCLRKRRYETERQARRQADEYERQGKGIMRVYHCPLCGGWHITSTVGDWGEHDRRAKRMFKEALRKCGFQSYGEAFAVVARFLLEHWKEVIQGEDGIDARWQEEYGVACHHGTNLGKKVYALAA